MKVELALLEDREELRKIFVEYLHELCIYSNELIPAEYPYFDLYWVEEGRWPFILRDEGEIEAFALVRQVEQRYEMAEFYVRPSVRRRGIGKEFASYLIDKFRGSWSIHYGNINWPAQNFWEKVSKEVTAEVYLIGCK